METLFIGLLNMSVAAGWLILAVLLLRFVLWKAPKSVRCILWALVGIRLILPFSVESILSLIPSVQTFSPSILYSENPSIHSGIAFLNSTVNPAISEMLAPSAGASANPIRIVASVASIVWFFGMAALLLYGTVSYVQLRRRVCSAVFLRDNIRQSETVSSPFILGLSGRASIFRSTWLRRTLNLSLPMKRRISAGAIIGSSRLHFCF